MVSGQIWETVDGSTDSFPLTLTDDAGFPITTWTNAATLTGAAGYGDSRGAAWNPTVTWVDPTSGTITVTNPATATAGLDPGLYRFYITITDGAGQHTRQVGFLRLLAAVGTGTVGPVYCSFDDMLKYAPWIADLITIDPSMQSDLAEQRGRARSWLDELIVIRDRASEWYRWGMSATDPNLGRWGFGRYGDTFPNSWLRDQLAANTLIVNDRVKEITARKAVAYACENQLGKANGENGTPYSLLARRYHAQATNLIYGYVAEIDLSTPPDGIADYMVRCGVMNCR